MTESEFIGQIMRNPVNARLLDILPSLDIPQCTLTAGALFQTVWNLKSGRSADWGIKDYDIFYFDAADLSWEAENSVIERVRRAVETFCPAVEVKNQARVHLWYAERFGEDYPVLRNVEGGIDRYLIACTRFGVRVADGRLYAPDGFDDMAAGILRINPLNALPALFKAKCAQYRERWPWLTIAQTQGHGEVSPPPPDAAWKAPRNLLS